MRVDEKINIPGNKTPVVLVAPLDWGLGHATRCIPLIKYLLNVGCEVIVASDGRQQLLLEQEFNNIRFVQLKGYGIKYSDKSWLTAIKIFFQIPAILRSIKSENSWLSNFIKTTKIDAVISDNRYGLYNKKIISALITHQLTIKAPFSFVTTYILRKINYGYICNFTECWIPDFSGTVNLAGELSHPPKLPSIPVKYLGRISRIKHQSNPQPGTRLLVLLSGPEPQRTVFEEILLKQFCEHPVKAVMLRGLPGEAVMPQSSNKDLTLINHASQELMNELINDATVIISRSGYSTILDIAGLQKKAVFVPTPGQPEQEYLAKYLSGKGFCIFFRQRRFSLIKALEAAESFKPGRFSEPLGLYQDVLKDFIRRASDG